MNISEIQDAINNVARQKRINKMLIEAFYRLSFFFLVSVIFACVAFQFRQSTKTILIDRKGQVYEPRLLDGESVNGK